MIFTASLRTKQITLHDPDNIIGDVVAAWTPQEFAVLTGITPPADLYSISYEPDVGLYQVVTKTGPGQPNQLTKVDDPTEHPVLNDIHMSLEIILRDAEYRYLKATADYPDDDFSWNGSSWDLVPADNRDEMDARAWFGQNISSILVAVSFLWEIAERKNLFAGETVPASVTNTMTVIQNHRDKLV